MKKFLAMLLVAVMAISCFSGCNPKKGEKTDLGESLNQLTTLLENADAIKEEFTVTLGVTLDQPLLSQESLMAMLGERGAMLLPILTPFIKNDKTAEIPMSVKGIATQDGDSRFVMTLGSGANAFACDGIAADGDVFVNIKALYEWITDVFEPIIGEEAPVWPSQNSYVSFMDIMALVQGMTDLEGAYSDVEAEMLPMSNTMSGATQMESSASMLESMMGMASMNPEMITAIAEALAEAIPEQSLVDLIHIIETALTDAGMLVTQGDSMTITVNGDNMKNLPEAISDAAEGKLGAIIDSIVEGIQNSDNDIIAAMIPADIEIDGQELEDQLLDELANAEDATDALTAQMNAMDFEAKFTFKTTSKGADCNLSIKLDFDEEGLSGTITLSAAAKVEATKKVSIQAPNDVMTETELSNFLASFMQ